MLVKLSEFEKQRKILVSPPIPLEIPSEKKKEKGEFIKIDLKSNPSDADSKTYSFSIQLLYKATPEEILKFMDNFNMIINGQGITDAANKFGMMRNLLRGDALRVFDKEETSLGAQTDANFVAITNSLVEYFFPPNALITQKRYMRRFMRKSRETKIRDFYVRVLEMNNRCDKFPPFGLNQKMANDEIKEIIEFAAPQSWQKELLRQGIDVTNRSIEGIVDFFERLEISEQIYGSANGEKKDEKRKGQRATEGDSLDKRGSYQTARRSSSSRRLHKKRKYVDEGDECPIHGYDHSMGECKVLRDQGRRMRAQWMAKKHSEHKSYKKYSGEKREHHNSNKYKLNKNEINEIAEQKKASSPRSDSSAGSDAESKRAEASSSSDSSIGEDLYAFDRLSIKSKRD